MKIRPYKQEEELLTTKLQAPLLRSDLLARPELIERLDDGLHLRLTLISAPAGSGKSTLLSAWSASHMRASDAEMERPLHVAWLALEAGDNDPVRFWRYVAAALTPAQSGGMAGVASLFPRVRQEMEAVLTGLLNSLAAATCTFALILDDYHLIEEEAIHRACAFFLEHLPPHVHLFIASRADPPLPLARLRARGQLQELRGAELRFTLDETGAFLRQASGQALSESELAALDARVEGWVAGLQLLALSLRGRADAGSFLASFNGTHRHIVDYLAGEVLDYLPADLQTFLLQTSVLERLNAALCRAVTGRDDSQELLEHLEQSNLFVIPLDDERGWYRYHHLFADVLRRRLLARWPDQPAESHRRASVWFEQAGLKGAAIEHALEARDFERAARFIERDYGRMVGRGELVTLMRWLKALPPALVESSIKLLMGNFWSLVGVGLWDEADRCLQAVERQIGEPMPRELRANLFTARASLLSGRGDTCQAVHFLQQALACLPEENLMQRSYILLDLAMVQWANNELEAMQHTLASAWQVGRESGHSYVALAALCNLASLQYARGKGGEALSLYQQAMAYIENASQTLTAQQEFPGAGFTRQGMGALLYEFNDLEGARRHFEESGRLARLTHDVRLYPVFYLEQARLHIALGKLSQARTFLRKLEDFLALETLLAYHRPMITVSLSRLWLLIGERERALDWLQHHYLPQARSYPCFYIHEASHLLAARVYLTLGEYASALELLHRLAETAEADGRQGSLVGILILRALTQQAQGEGELAVGTLARALLLGEQNGSVRTFVDEGTALLPLLLEVHTRLQRRALPGEADCSLAYVRRLLNLLDGELAQLAEQSASGDGQPPGATLSPRELEVLRLVAAGLSNQEIAERLVIALSTLKTHINHIYSKLEARDRLQAVVRARSLGLI